jgi:PhoH-like ATPase
LHIIIPVSKTLSRVIKQTTYGIDPRNAEQTFAIEALSNPDIQLVSLTGKAGTGKTLLALAAALQQHKRYKQIFLARPIVPLANRDLGFLPVMLKKKWIHICNLFMIILQSSSINSVTRALNS